MRDQALVQAVNDKEKAAWLSFVDVMKNFLGNKKAGNHEDLVNNMLSAFHDLGCKMSIKVHFLFGHLDKFPDNLGAVSDEQVERFYQEMMAVEERYQGRCDCNMLADYCRSIKRDCPIIVHRSQNCLSGNNVEDQQIQRVHKNYTRPSKSESFKTNHLL